MPRQKGYLSPRVLKRANDFLDLLRQQGPLTAEDIMAYMGINEWTFGYTLKLARRLADQQPIKLAIPKPIAEDGYRYKLTGELISATDYEIYDGVMSRMVDEATREMSTLRDIRIAESNMKGASKRRKQIQRWIRELDGRAAAYEKILEDMQDNVILPPVAVANGQTP